MCEDFQTSGDPFFVTPHSARCFVTPCVIRNYLLSHACFTRKTLLRTYSFTIYEKEPFFARSATILCLQVIISLFLVIMMNFNEILFQKGGGDFE